MRIVFGWYSFKLKTYTPEELELQPEHTQGMSFEVRQKCAHIFWIPIFSIGKMYAVRKQDQLYDVPPQVSQLMKSKGSLRTPWYCFSLPILAVVGLLVFLGIEKYQNYQYRQRNIAEHEYKMTKLEKELARLSPDHYIKLTNPRNSYSSKGIYLKVINKTGDQIKYVFLNTGMDNYNTTPLDVKAYYYLYGDTLDTLSMNISELRKALPKDYEQYEHEAMTGISFAGGKGNYIIDEINYVKGPDIRYDGVISWGGGTVGMEFTNFGETAQLVEIKNIEGNINWNLELPRKIESSQSEYDRFQLDGGNYKPNTSYKFLMVFSDSLKNTYKFMVEGKGWEGRIERL